jgi:hypothetical protein
MKPLQQVMIYNETKGKPFPQLNNMVAIMGKEHNNLTIVLHGQFQKKNFLIKKDGV